MCCSVSTILTAEQRCMLGTQVLRACRNSKSLCNIESSIWWVQAVKLSTRVGRVVQTLCPRPNAGYIWPITYHPILSPYRVRLHYRAHSNLNPSLSLHHSFPFVYCYPFSALRLNSSCHVAFHDLLTQLKSSIVFSALPQIH